MSLIEKMMQPLGLDALRAHFDESRCLVLEGDAKKFKDLISLDDIERRLNDGSNANVFAQIIKNGTRNANIDGDVPWTPACIDKTQFTQDIAAGFSFMMANSSQINSNIAKLTDEIEDFFADESMRADVHLYVSTDGNGNSYNAHRDRPQHKILLQAYGSAHWQIFAQKSEDLPDNVVALTDEEQGKHLEVAADFVLKQGDLLYMPPGTFHKVVDVSGPRVSISIPFYSLSNAKRMDRSHIPFKEIFESQS